MGPLAVCGTLKGPDFDKVKVIAPDETRAVIFYAGRASRFGAQRGSFDADPMETSISRSK